MRTTVQIDDHLLQTLKEQAHREGISLAKLINRVLQCGMTAMQRPAKRAPAYREKTVRMGAPKVPLDKALALAAALEDEETLEKMARRK